MGWSLYTHKFFTGADLRPTSAVADSALSYDNSACRTQLPLYQVIWSEFVAILTVGFLRVSRHKISAAQGVFPRGYSLKMYRTNARRTPAQMIAVHMGWNMGIYKQLVHHATRYLVRTSARLWLLEALRFEIGKCVPSCFMTPSPIPARGSFIKIGFTNFNSGEKVFQGVSV